MNVALMTVLLLGAPPQEATPKTAETVKVKRGDLKLTLKLDGTFEPVELHEISLRPKVYTGKTDIIDVVEPGTRVSKGQILIGLETELGRRLKEVRLDVDDAGDAHQSAKDTQTFGNGEDALARIESDRRLKHALAALKYFDEVDGKEMLTRADLSLKSSKDSLADQEEELRQLEKMYKSEELTSDTAEIVVRRARRRLDRSRIYLEFARENTRYTKKVTHPRRRAELEHSVKQAENKNNAMIARQMIETARRDRAVTRAQMKLKKEQERLGRLQGDATALEARAPVAGIVYYGSFRNGAWSGADELARKLKPGESAPTGQVVMTIVAPGALRVRAKLPEASALEVRPGMKAEIVPTAMSDAKLDGTIEAVQMDVLHIAVPDLDARLRPGFTCKATLSLGERKNALLIPNSAIGKDSTVTLPGGETRKIVTGKSDGEQTEVLEGLAEGDEILLKGPK